MLIIIKEVLGEIRLPCPIPKIPYIVKRNFIWLFAYVEFKIFWSVLQAANHTFVPVIIEIIEINDTTSRIVKVTVAAFI